MSGDLISLKAGLISVSGIDTQKFLQGLVTADINEITPDQYRNAACCNAKGRVIGTFKLFLYKGNYYLALPEANLPIVMGHLKKYAMFSKVEIKDVSARFYKAGGVGETILKKLHLPLPEAAHSCISTPSSIFLRLPGDANRFEMYSEEPIAGMPTLFQEDPQWKKYNVLAGIPSIYPQTSGLFTPQMINFDQLGGISFQKGCYLGQEIIARTAHLGSAKKHLYIATLDSDQAPSIGEPLYDQQGNEIGTLLEVVLDSSCLYLQAVIQDKAVSEKIFCQNREALLRIYRK